MYPQLWFRKTSVPLQSMDRSSERSSKPLSASSLYCLRWSFIHIPQSNLIVLWAGYILRWLLSSGHLAFACGLAFIKGKFKTFRCLWCIHSLHLSSWNHSFHEHWWKMVVALWNPWEYCAFSRMKTILVQFRSMTWHLDELQANISNADLGGLLFASFGSVHYVHWLQRHLSILSQRKSQIRHVGNTQPTVKPPTRLSHYLISFHFKQMRDKV